MLKNIFATIGLIFTAVKGYEMYGKYKDVLIENKLYRPGGCCHFPDIDDSKAEE